MINVHFITLRLLYSEVIVLDNLVGGVLDVSISELYNVERSLPWVIRTMLQMLVYATGQERIRAGDLSKTV